VIAIILPVLAFRTQQLLGGRRLPMPRPIFYWQTILLQVVLYGVALFAAATNLIVLTVLPKTPRALWALCLLAVSLGSLRAVWPLRSRDSKSRLCDLLPHGRGELLPYLLLCVVASVAEEVAYRGVAYRLVFRLVHSIPLAVVLVALAFALGHMVQGWRSVAVIFLFAIGFHAVVIYGQSLLPAILVHFAFDAIAGLVVPRWCASEGID
jgi:membrane protease YdiL (CAAX protease family)